MDWADLAEWSNKHIGPFDAAVRAVSDKEHDGVLFLVGRTTNKPPRFDEPVLLGLSVNWTGDQFAWEFDSAAHARSFIRRVFDAKHRYRDEPNRYIDGANRMMDAYNAIEVDDYKERAQFALAALYFWSRYYVTNDNPREQKRALNNMDSLRASYVANKRRAK